MFFVNEDTLDQMATCDDWNHDSNTLLVVDYAGIEPALLHRCFVNVANYEKKFEKKLRIILLDRIGNLIHQKPFGEYAIYNYISLFE